MGEAVEDVVKLGYHSTVVEYVARMAGRALSTQALAQMVQELQDDEGDCGICFATFGLKCKMVFRRCCRQPICRSCDYKCHCQDKPCAFCRSTCGASVRHASL